MFKVSFISEPEVSRPKNSRATIVKLSGKMEYPEVMFGLPPSIRKWVYSVKSVNTHSNSAVMYIDTVGKAVRHVEDKDNPELGRRIAEARAKLHLYKFMSTLTDKLYTYYSRMLSSDTSTEANAGDNTLAGANLKYSNLYTREKAHLKALLAYESDTESTSQS